MKKWFRRGELKLKNSASFSLRQGARRVFYPGCSLPGADPDLCSEVFAHLKQQDPEIGLWFDCCAKPLRLGGDRGAAQKEERRVMRRLRDAGVEEVISACCNCAQQFSEIEAAGLRVRMVYDLLEVDNPRSTEEERVLHHPCFARQRPDLQDGVLRLADQLGLKIKNREQAGHPLACCLQRNEGALRRRAALARERLLTYCAHCVMTFQSDIPSRHLLQEMFGSQAVWRQPGKVGLFANYRRFRNRISALFGN